MSQYIYDSFHPNAHTMIKQMACYYCGPPPRADCAPPDCYCSPPECLAPRSDDDTPPTSVIP